MKVSIIGSFTCDPLIDVFNFWQKRLRVPIEPRVVSGSGFFPSLHAQASSPASAGCPCVVLVRLADLGDVDTSPDLIEDLAALIGEIAAKGRVLLLPCPGGELQQAMQLQELEARLLELVSGMSSVDVCTAIELFDRYSVSDVDDRHADRAAQIPYTEPAYAALSSGIVRWLLRDARPPLKMVCVDGDNTLWDGVLGEDGAAGIHLSAQKQNLQSELAAAASDGVILSLVTNNDKNDVEDLFKVRKDFPLTRADFLAIDAGWTPKAERIASTTNAYQVSTESVLFIDDNPVECAAIKAAFPDMVVIQASPDGKSGQFARHLWPLDRGRVTESDKSRIQSYRDDDVRRSEADDAHSLEEFFGKLKLQVEIDVADRSDARRLAQLAARTNQFNLSLDRRSEVEIESDIAATDRQVYAVRVRDRFGDYGLVGGVFTRNFPDKMEINGWTLSCRALGRGVEHKIAAFIGSEAKSADVSLVEFTCKLGPRNEPAIRFLTEIAGHPLQNDGKVSIGASDLSEVRFDPSSLSAFSPRDEKPSPRVKQSNRNFLRVPDEVYADIATSLTSGDLIIQAMRGHRRERPSLDVPFVAPAAGLQQEVAEIWGSVLNIDAVGVDDDLNSLGARSIDLVRIHAALEGRLGLELDLADLFRISSIRQLTEKATVTPESMSQLRHRASKIRIAKRDLANRRSARGSSLS